MKITGRPSRHVREIKLAFFSIIGLTEIWVTDSCTNVLDIPGYK